LQFFAAAAFGKDVGAMLFDTSNLPADVPYIFVGPVLPN
jgi:hypothetical protein